MPDSSTRLISTATLTRLTVVCPVTLKIAVQVVAADCCLPRSRCCSKPARATLLSPAVPPVLVACTAALHTAAASFAVASTCVSLCQCTRPAPCTRGALSAPCAHCGAHRGITESHLTSLQHFTLRTLSLHVSRRDLSCGCSGRSVCLCSSVASAVRAACSKLPATSDLVILASSKFKAGKHSCRGTMLRV